MSNIKEQIIDWFNGPQDYDQGVDLLQEVSNKNKVIKKLLRRGETRDSLEKLVYELNKIAGFKKIPERKAAAAKKTSKTKPVKTEKPGSGKIDEQEQKFNLIGDKDIDSYPPETNRLVKEYSSLYNERGKKHGELKKLGDGNDQETIDKRKTFIDEIKTLSDRMEVLYKAFIDFEENGTPVNPEILWPEGDQQSEQKDQVQTGSIEDLKTLKKNLQSSLTKDRNLLLYGIKTQPKNGNGKPMAAGPKRTILEKRVVKKEKEITVIDQQIADLS
jgi:hypothetical protein